MQEFQRLSLNAYGLNESPMSIPLSKLMSAMYDYTSLASVARVACVKLGISTCSNYELLELIRVRIAGDLHPTHE